jgi:tetratricopeptide (TPR) repeat protein
MAIQPSSPTLLQRIQHRVKRIGQRLLLVPESALIVVLMLPVLLGEQGIWPGVALTLLTIWLVARVAAMYQAQQALLAARHDEAALMAQIAHRMHPWSADALALRGVIAASRGSFSEALVLLRRSLLLAPESSAVYATISGVLLALGRPSAARLAAQTALALDPHCTVAYLYLADSQRHEGASMLEVEDTLRAGLAVARRAEDEAALGCALAAVLMAEGRGAEASLVLAGMERLLAACPPSAQGRLRLRYGELLIAQGQVDRARDYLQGTIVIEQIAPSRGEAFSTQGA